MITKQPDQRQWKGGKIAETDIQILTVKQIIQQKLLIHYFYHQLMSCLDNYSCNYRSGIKQN
jgi:hypothetical protein